MAQPTDSTRLHDFVGQVVEHASQRLTTAARDARARQAELTKAKTDAGNRLRSEDIRTALDAEAQLAADAQALAKRMPSIRQSMNADLERLLELQLPWDGAGGP